MMLKITRILLVGCMALTMVACSSSADPDGGEDENDVYLFTSFKEPATDGLRLLYSHDGYHWKALDHIFLKPNVGKSKLMRDPSIERGPDGTFHLVWTAGWRGDLGIGYASSKDLIHWSEQQFLPVMEHEPGTVNVWAPELYYDEDKDRFIIIWASTIPHRFPKGLEAEDNNHRMYYTTTKDFKTFSDTKLFLDPGFSVIDAVIVKQDAGKYALILKDNTRPNRNIRMAFGNGPLGPWSEASEPFTGKFTEGPTEVKIGEDYLIYYDVYEEDTYHAVKTQDFKTFVSVNDSISVPEGHKHGTIFRASAEILKKLKRVANNQVANN